MRKLFESTETDNVIHANANQKGEIFIEIFDMVSRDTAYPSTFITLSIDETKEFIEHLKDEILFAEQISKTLESKTNEPHTNTSIQNNHSSNKL